MAELLRVRGAVSGRVCSLDLHSGGILLADSHNPGLLLGPALAERHDPWLDRREEWVWPDVHGGAWIDGGVQRLRARLRCAQDERCHFERKSPERLEREFIGFRR